MLRAVQVAVVCVAVATVGQVHAGVMTFSSSGTFVVPTGVFSVDVLAIGGGGGGANGHQGGGGSGYVGIGTFAVTPGQSIPVMVGLGGTGAVAQINSNSIVGLTPGQSSSFGGFLSVAGGGVVSAVNAPAGNGGSGGGASWNGGTPFTNNTPGGTGGSGGSNGQTALYSGGIGQGNYVPGLALFSQNVLSAGAGGIGSTFNGFWNGGGGAGGILINGGGPNGFNGSQTSSGQGGFGYGAGGGAGGYDGTNSGIRYAGGNGADGLVYVEYVDSELTAVPEPSSLALLATGAFGFIGYGWRRKRKLAA